jgi:hypothetical protein
LKFNGKILKQCSMENQEVPDDNNDLENVMLRVKRVGDDLQVHLGNMLYDWDDYNFDLFLRKAFARAQWKEGILRTIARNDEWYEEVKKYRNQKS